MRVMGASTPGSSVGLVRMLLSAEPIRRAFTSCGASDGATCSSCATPPATTGAAPEVPPKTRVPVPEPTTALTEAPGAPMSGLIAP